MARLVGAEYDNKNLQEILTGVFGTTTLQQLNKRVLVPAFELDNQALPGKVHTWKPKFFHNFPGPDSDGQEVTVDVALRTSAAPTYFPVYQSYIDGGVVANNPSMAALAQAIDANTGKQNLGELRLFSLGTGLSPTYIAGQSHNWGFAQWAKPLVNLMIEGMMGVADYQCAHLLGEHYHRLGPVLPEAVGLDAADRTDDLIQYAQDVDIAAAVAWLRQNF